MKFRKQYMFNDDIVHETLLYFTFHVARGHQQDTTPKLASWTYRGFASDPGFCIHASAKKSHGAPLCFQIQPVSPQPVDLKEL